MSKIKPIGVGDIIFVVVRSNWRSTKDHMKLGNYIVSKVNNSSFYAHSIDSESDKASDIRFNRKTWLARPQPGYHWQAYESEKQFNQLAVAKQQHELQVGIVQAEAKNLTTEELKKVHAYMKELLFDSKRKKKRFIAVTNDELKKDKEKQKED